MRIADQPTKMLMATAAGILIVAWTIYVTGAYLTRVELCMHRGGHIATLGVAFAVLAAGVLCARAVILRSTASWLAFVGAILMSATMYFFVGVMYAGCGGI